MSYVIEKNLPPADLIIRDLPASPEIQEKVLQDRQDIVNILEGSDPRKILIVGPCSAWPSRSVIEYAEKLGVLTKKHEKTLKIVMRTYLQKPRTTIGWLGPLTQPNPFEKSDLEKGITYCRSMMLEVLKLGVPMADEALFTHNDGYFVDLLSWVAIGARSSEDQEHRIFASMIPHPVGIKHPTSGDIEKGVNSIVAAQNPHVFALHRKQIQTSGNPHAHMILRGGNGKSNYNQASIEKTIALMEKQKVQNPSIILDLSHENSIDPLSGKKDHHRQPVVLQEVLATMKKNPQIQKHVKGFMAESFIHGGKQDLNKAQSMKDLTPGCSITDGCLSWEQTVAMIEHLATNLRTGA